MQTLFWQDFLGVCLVFFKGDSINVFLPTDSVFKLGKCSSLCLWIGGRGKIYGASEFPWEFPRRPLGNC